KLLASVSKDTTIRLWDGLTGQAAGILRGHTPLIDVLAFSTDGRWLVTGSNYPENAVRLWDVATGQEVVPTFSGHRNGILTVNFSPDGSRIVACSRDQTASLLDGTSGKLIRELLGHTGDVVSAVFSPNSKRLVTSSSDQTLRIWDAQTGECIAVLRGHTG